MIVLLSLCHDVRFLSSDLLDDRRLLQLAKRVAANWDQLARLLSVAEDEVGDLLLTEGHSHHGAFRMLWEWREASSNLETSFNLLLDALRQLGHSDDVEQIFR